MIHVKFFVSKAFSKKKRKGSQMHYNAVTPEIQSGRAILRDDLKYV
jgi:hypothetical protein